MDADKISPELKVQAKKCTTDGELADVVKQDGTGLSEDVLGGVSGGNCQVVNYRGSSCDEVDIRQIILCGSDCSAWECSGYTCTVVTD